MSLKHFHVLQEDDDDPMLSAVNLVDVFLVLVVALLTAVAAQSQTSAASQDKVTIIKNEGQPNMEIIVRENGQEVKFKGNGQVGAAQGQRAGVAYQLKDGHIVYVPESQTSQASVPTSVPAEPTPRATGQQP
jgi:hypothetical protein